MGHGVPIQAFSENLMSKIEMGYAFGRDPVVLRADPNDIKRKGNSKACQNRPDPFKFDIADAEVAICSAFSQFWWEGFVTAMNPKLDLKLVKARPWGDAVCEWSLALKS